MTAAALAHELRSRGIKIWLESGSVCIEDPLKRLSPTEVRFLRRHKADVVAFLSAPGGHVPCAYFCGKVSRRSSHDLRLPDKHCRVCGGVFADYFENIGNFIVADSAREFRIPKRYEEDEVA